MELTGQSKRESRDKGIVHERFEQPGTLFRDTNVLEHGDSILDVLNFRGRSILKMVENLEDLVVFQVETALNWNVGCHVRLAWKETIVWAVETDKSNVAQTWRSPRRNRAKNPGKRPGQAPLTFP